MGIERLVAVVLCVGVGVGVACSSSGPAKNESAADASGSDAELGDGGASPSDAAPSDAPNARALPDGASADGSDATVVSCPPPKFPRWDGSLPEGDICSSPDDTDRDGIPDCIDGCPYDADKIAPGACGCGISDIDTDGDGVPDCNDRCPLDPNNTYDGQCGCVGGVGLQPAGTPCTDSACPQPGATCDGAGVCGDRSVCSPCPGGHFIVTDDGPRLFWFCGASLPSVTGPNCSPEDAGGGPTATRMAAQAACAAKGLTMARIESLSNNRFVAQFLTAPLWIGANDLQTPGQWYWPSATSDSDELFWSGGLDGSPQSSLYSNWASSAPGSASCASMSAVDGTWSDTTCTESLGYICENLLLP